LRTQSGEDEELDEEEQDEEEFAEDTFEELPDAAAACAEQRDRTCASSSDCLCVSGRPTVSRCFHETPAAPGVCQVFDLQAAGIFSHSFSKLLSQNFSALKMLSPEKRREPKTRICANVRLYFA